MPNLEAELVANTYLVKRDYRILNVTSKSSISYFQKFHRWWSPPQIFNIQKYTIRVHVHVADTNQQPVLGISPLGNGIRLTP